MNFSCDRPYALYGLLFLIPAILYAIKNYLRLKSLAQDMYSDKINIANKNMHTIMKRKVLLRSIFRCLAWLFLVLSYAGFSWGTVSVPVQKSGTAISCVFDISYSMNAKDAPGNLTRLNASAKYASMLLEHVENSSVSAVIAKGDGSIAIPLTEDLEIIRSFLSMLSPSLMSSPGSSLGSGVEAAIRSFPRNSSQTSVIWLFTDGDETDSSLVKALNNAVKNGIPVVIIGFGSELETEITTGDGITTKKTALRSELLKRICAEVNKQNGNRFQFLKTGVIRYVDSTEVSSALKVLSSIKSNSKLENNSNQYTMSYELENVNRQGLFIGLGLLCFILSFLFYEFNFHKIKLHSSMALLLFCFTSCGTSFKDANTILDSTWNWYKRDYDKATTGFLSTVISSDKTNSALTKQYALYGLSVTYLMQNETDASVARMAEIASDAPESIKFASYYNSGIIAQRKGNYSEAVELFKKSLLVDGTNVNAKINLELSLNQQLEKVREGEQEMTPTSENANDSSMTEKSVFKRMRENDKQQWKNQEQETKNNSEVIDY